MLKTLGDVLMVAVLVTAAVAALWHASGDPLVGIGAGLLLLAFYAVLELRSTTRALDRLYQLLGGKGEPVRQEFAAAIRYFRQVLEEMRNE